MARTPLVAFFNIPFMKLKTYDGGESSTFVKVLRISDSAGLQDSWWFEELQKTKRNV
jgi:hypothetical protein